MKQSTSWGEAAVIGDYQKNLILPNLLRLLEIKKGEVILDIGCGPGFFAREFARKGAKIIGVDISKGLIAAATKSASNNENYIVGSADDLSFLKDKSIDKITIILAIQNIDNVHKVFAECRRVLKVNGQMFLVLNHPALRIPKASDWGWDPEKSIQYRRVDAYMTETKEKIAMHPSTLRQTLGKPEEYTITFHRPLQLYFKFLHKNGFSVSRLEDWISNRKSEPGPRAKAEDSARKEIPLFLFMEAVI